jgi:hypothetical protein
MKNEKNIRRRNWNNQFEKAISNGELSEGDLFEEIVNDFDEQEWTWNIEQTPENNQLNPTT